MKIRAILFMIAVLAGMGSPTTAAAEPVVLAASSPWVLDYAEDSCALRRFFADGDKQAILEMRRFAPNFAMLVSMGTNALHTRHDQYVYRFDPTEEWRDGGNIYAHFDEMSGVVFEGTLSQFPTSGPADAYSGSAEKEYEAWQAQAAGRISQVSVLRGFDHELVLKTGPLAAPWAALSRCLDELVTHWGIDAEAHKTLSRRATPTNLATVPRMIDYPPKMLAKRMPGIVNLRLAIDETGAITGCYIQMPLGDPAFEKSSCADLEHALEFEPALDKDGKPIKSYWHTQVSFRLH